MNEYVRQYLTVEYWKNLCLSFWHALHTKRFWKELVIMTFGMLLGAGAVYYFLMPSNIIVGTISGLGLVLNAATHGNPDTLAYWVTGINAILLVMAFLLIGNEFGAKTVYTALILGPLLQFWDRVYPYTNFTHKVIDAPAIQAQLQAGETVLDLHGNPYLLDRSGHVLEQIKDSVMSAGVGLGDVWFDLLCFVFLLSVCQAIEFRINASTGGLDILAKIVNKYFHFDIGTCVTICGGLICCTAFLINDFRMVVIGLIGTWINGIVINYLSASFNRRKRVCIISPEYEKIRRYIVDDLVRGCSLYTIRGGYKNEENIEIQTLLTQEEFSSLMYFMRTHGINAFTTAGDCSEVYGLWAKHKRKNGRVALREEE